ncbi:hypothetical protein FQR65_LT09998 [Abscondita terminalis]|nr:hypothetical protein FQR65_LT09998 [Abscondita terminalis]
MSTIHSTITTHFLRSLIKSYNDEVNTLEFAIIPISAGENFASTVFKIKINYNTSSNDYKEASFILKCLMEGGFLSRYAKIMKFYDNEIDMYNRILPTINSLEYVNKFWAPSLYATLLPQPILILDDLTKHGYKMQCRHNGLDLNHCLLVMEKLAYLHASSIAIKKKVNTFFKSMSNLVSDLKESLKNFNLGLFWANPYTMNWISVGLQSLIKTCTNFNHLNEYATKLQSIQHQFLKKAFASIRKSKICNVLNHGDCWVNNLMFSYNNDGSVKDAVLLDLQQCIYSSPVLDLHYFWVTSPNCEVLKKHFSYIIDHYYNQFILNLKILKVDENVPTKHEIMKEFKEKAVYGLNILITSTLFIKSSKRSDATFENYLKYSGEGSFRHDCHNNERYLERIAYFLPFYDSLDVFC